MPLPLDKIDIHSFIYYILIQELFKNIDGYRRSVFIYIKDGKVFAGPVWDFNLAMGNLWFYDQSSPKGWQHGRHYIDGNKEIAWYKNLLKNPVFRANLIQQYNQLRRFNQPFHEKTILSAVDEMANELSEASTRHFTRWNILGRPLITFWFSPPCWPGTYPGEISKLKDWLKARLEWLDRNINQI
jgi:hypothetical protein